MDSNKETIIIFSGGNCFHAVDWYNSLINKGSQKNFIYLTDLYSGEDLSMISNIENVLTLYIIDEFLPNYRTQVGDFFRNFIKLLFVPIQVFLLKRILKKFKNSIVHSHGMYYGLLMWLSGFQYVLSPIGSEILERPYQSFIYRFFARKILKKAKHIIVDSTAMASCIKDLASRDCHIFQYGFDASLAFNLSNKEGFTDRKYITSVRALYPLYNIDKIFETRNKQSLKFGINYFYPYHDVNYRNYIYTLLQPVDRDLGRLPTKDDVYAVLSQTILAISIPSSDSSPRSVAEAIFCGAAVATTKMEWYEDFPVCMKNRVILIDINSSDWLYYSLIKAKEIVAIKYIPTSEAIAKYDKNVIADEILSKIYI